MDAGGKGFLVILQGMLDELRGLPMPEVMEEKEGSGDKADFEALSVEDITFAFDTVYIIRKDREDVDLEPLRRYLNSIGDSLVIGEDDTAFKVHVHTNIPGQALTESQKYGTLELAKIENMRTQAEDLARPAKHVQSTDDLENVERELEAGGTEGPAKAAPEKKFGYVAVCAGAGLEAVFRDLGVDGLVGGGQTMNPSTEDILKEIERTPAEIVYVLPNNKNIIMAAEQCVSLCEDKKVVVLPTKTIPQGISAMLCAEPDASEEDNTAAMTDGFSRVRTSEIPTRRGTPTLAALPSSRGTIWPWRSTSSLARTGTWNPCWTGWPTRRDTRRQSLSLSSMGEDVTEEQAQRAEEIFAAACPKAEVSLLPGMQQHCP